MDPTSSPITADTPPVRVVFVAWLRDTISAGTILTITATVVTVIVGQLIATGARQERDREIEKRLTKIEANYVPREESRAKDQMIFDEFTDVKHQLAAIQDVLMERNLDRKLEQNRK